MMPSLQKERPSCENIFLIGLMGAGKSSVGRLLAKDLGKSFIDCDIEVERRTGVSVSVIFEIEGEEGFRRCEAMVLRELTALRNVVVATGGGAVLLPENRETLSKNGTVVYLRATVDELWHRTRNDRHRPLLRTEDPRSILSELYDQRDPLYREVAHFIVDTGNQSLRTLASRLEARLRSRPSWSC